MKYDARFLIKHLKVTNYLVNGSSYITTKGHYENYSFELKCSYKLIVAPLGKFGKMFNLKQGKEVMPYNLYTEENVNKQFVPISEALKHLKKDDIEQFMKNLREWDLIQGDMFDCVEYSRHYCEIDCLVLQKGYETFRKWFKDDKKFDMDIDEILTAASIASNFFGKNKCYDGCYFLSNIPRHFIQKCVVGGRVMCAWGKKSFPDLKGEHMSDFDAVSLYPSAMKRLAACGGYLKGKPKVIAPENCNLEWLSKQDGYFVEAKVLKVGINRAFPVLSYISEAGSRQFSNQEMVGRTVHIDKITLENAMKFQKCEFEIIRGYYFDEGRNNTIGSTIQYVFDERKRLKKEKNPQQAIFKLIMNSSYGKLCQKPAEDSTEIMSEIKMKNCIEYSYNSIKEITKIQDDQYLVKRYTPIDSHMNMVHLATEVLSMSKRIMFEVMYTAEDNNIPIFYTDTDSMHILDKDIPKLQKLYNAKYGRELIGTEMGQFHSDFEMDGCKNVLATESVFLGKKCYCDKLVGKNIKTGKMEVGYHIRMKGNSNKSIIHRCKHKPKKAGPYEPETFENVMELYKYLYSGKRLSFDLLCGGNEISFEFTKDMIVKSREEFIRTVQF